MSRDVFGLWCIGAFLALIVACGYFFGDADLTAIGATGASALAQCAEVEAEAEGMERESVRLLRSVNEYVQITSTLPPITESRLKGTRDDVVVASGACEAERLRLAKAKFLRDARAEMIEYYKSVDIEELARESQAYIEEAWRHNAVDNLTDAISETGGHLTAVPWNSAWDAEAETSGDSINGVRSTSPRGAPTKAKRK